MHAVIKIIFYIDHIKNAENLVAAILDMQISTCNVNSGYEVYVDRGFELRSSKTKAYKISICCSSA